MKIRVFLLSMLLLLLSVKPIVESAFSQAQGDACCKAKEDNHSASQSQKQQETNCDDFCSPFQPCCPYLTLANAQLALTIPKSFPLIEKSLPVYKASFNTSYSTDFWQPPKTV